MVCGASRRVNARLHGTSDSSDRIPLSYCCACKDSDGTEVLCEPTALQEFSPVCVYWSVYLVNILADWA